MNKVCSKYEWNYPCIIMVNNTRMFFQNKKKEVQFKKSQDQQGDFKYSLAY